MGRIFNNKMILGMKVNLGGKVTTRIKKRNHTKSPEIQLFSLGFQFPTKHPGMAEAKWKLKMEVSRHGK